MERGIAHEGTGRHQLVLLVHVALTDTLTHMLAAKLDDGLCSLGSVWVPETEEGSLSLSLDVS